VLVAPRCFSTTSTSKAAAKYGFLFFNEWVGSHAIDRRVHDCQSHD
jgi:hypothetical protein